MTAPFPTRKQEAFRYADLDALKSIWSDLSPPQMLHIAAQQKVQQVWLPSGEEIDVRRAGVTLEPGASAQLFALVDASRYARIELDIELREGADFTLDAAMIGGGDSTLEIVTTVRHVEPDATSRQYVRSVLGGKSTGSYLGKVEVARDAQRTDGEQSVKAILLDRGATANCKPELEIYADDVKCAHGASVGELDSAQLFYAMSRGLDPAGAKALLLEGFVLSLWDGIGDEVEREKLVEASRAALRRVARG